MGNFRINNEKNIETIIDEDKLKFIEERKSLVLTEEFFRNEPLLLKYYGRTNYSNGELDDVTNEYRKKCAVFMIEKYKWPVFAAKTVAKTIKLPRHRNHHSLNEYFMGYVAGALPSRYIDPIALATNRDPKFYKKLSVKLDILIAAPILASVYFNKEIGEMVSNLYAVFPEVVKHDLETIAQTYAVAADYISGAYEAMRNMPTTIGIPMTPGTITNGEVIDVTAKVLSLLKLDSIALLSIKIKLVQGFVRTASLYFLDYHLPSIAGIINPIIPEAIGMGYLNIHNIIKGVEEIKNKKTK